MTELIAYRYRQLAADGMHQLKWSKWKSGRLRSEMMAELTQIGKSNLVIVECCVPRATVDPINGRENDLWIWTRRVGWKKATYLNWYADSCDPTVRNDGNSDDPFDEPIDPERLAYWRKKLYGENSVQPITDAITTDEMATD